MAPTNMMRPKAICRLLLVNRCEFMDKPLFVVGMNAPFDPLLPQGLPAPQNANVPSLEHQS
jgi:hypothetical protein